MGACVFDTLLSKWWGWALCDLPPRFRVNLWICQLLCTGATVPHFIDETPKPETLRNPAGLLSPD